MAVIGGLMARGEGPCANSGFGGRNPPEDDDAPGENRLSGPLLKVNVGDVAGGLPAVLGPGVGAAAAGLPELNSAQRGHLRLVSGRRKYHQ